MTIKRRKFQLGIRLKGSTSATTLEGELRLDPSALKFKAYVDGSERSIVTEDQVQTVTNKVIDVDNNTLSNIETDNLKAGVLVTTISAATSDTELPSALAVKTALAGQNEASEITYDPAGNPETVATDVQAALDDTGTASAAAQADADTAQTTADDHIADAADAHTASAITNVPAGNLAATEVQAALNELQTDVDSRALDSALTDHLNDAVDAHDASAISYDNASSGLAATEAQAAIDEVEARLDTTEGVATGAAADLVTHEAETTTHGVTGNIVGTSDAQVITLKDIDGGTATNTSRITVPKAAKATLDALTRKEATIVYASDEKTLYADDGTSLQPIGSGNGGGLDSFYTEDFEGQVGAADFTVGNDVVFDNGGSFNGVFTNTTSSNISGDTSIIYTQASSSLNDFVKSPVIAVDKKQQDQTVGLTFYYTYDGDSDDIKVVGYDNTGAEVMTLASNLIKASSTAQRFSVEFPVPVDSTSISWGFQTVVENIGAVLVVDDVEISTNPFIYKNMLETPVVVEGSGNGGTALTGGVTDIDFTEVTDDLGIWNGSQLTVPSDGTYILTGNVVQSNSNNAINLYVDGVFERSVTFLGVTFTEMPFSITRECVAGEVVSIRSGNSVTLTNNADHHITITKIPTESENVIAYNSRNAENSMVRLHTANGYGSTNTVIRRFSTVVDNVGSAITYTDSATDGASFLINEDGVYTLSNTDNASGVSFLMGLSLNSTQLTTNIVSINASDRLAMGFANVGAGAPESMSWSGILKKGDIVRVHNDGDTGGTADLSTFTITKIGTGDLLGVPVPRTCYIKDVKSSGTNGGTFTSGDWRTRDLNDLSGDTEFVSLSANQFTLQPGKYEIEITAPVRGQVNVHKAKLRNITDSSDVLIGDSFISGTTDTSSVSTVKGQVEITSVKTFEAQHRCSVTKATDGFGIATSFGVDEVYTICKITKVSN
jgi:hypothetical protein